MKYIHYIYINKHKNNTTKILLKRRDIQSYTQRNKNLVCKQSHKLVLAKGRTFTLHAKAHTKLHYIKRQLIKKGEAEVLIIFTQQTTVLLCNRKATRTQHIRLTLYMITVNIYWTEYPLDLSTIYNNIHNMKGGKFYHLGIRNENLQNVITLPV